MAGAALAVSGGPAWPAPRLERAFFARPAPLVARQLLGQRLVHLDGGVRRAARIVEAEAYHGRLDRASHAWRGPTPRAGIMFGGARGGLRLRHLRPARLPQRRHRRGRASPRRCCCAPPSRRAAASTRPRGPGNLCRALGIERERHNGLDLGGGVLFFERGDEPAGASWRRAG